MDARRCGTLGEALQELASHPPIDPSAPVMVGFSPASNGYAAEDVVNQAIREYTDVAAKKNAENALLMRRLPSLAAQYGSGLNRRPWRHATDLRIRPSG